MHCAEIHKLLHTNFTKWESVRNVSMLQDSAHLPGFQWSVVHLKTKPFQREDRHVIMLRLTKEPQVCFDGDS